MKSFAACDKGLRVCVGYPGFYGLHGRALCIIFTKMDSGCYLILLQVFGFRIFFLILSGSRPVICGWTDDSVIFMLSSMLSIIEEGDDEVWRLCGCTRAPNTR